MRTIKATVVPPRAGLYDGTWMGRRVSWSEPGEGRGARPLLATVDEEAPRPFTRVTVEVGEDGSVTVTGAPIPGWGG